MSAQDRNVTWRNVSTTLRQPGSQFKLDSLRSETSQKTAQIASKNPPVDLWTTQERALTTTPQAPHQTILDSIFRNKNVAGSIEVFFERFLWKSTFCLGLELQFCERRVDPGCGWFAGWFWCAVNKTFWILAECDVEGDLARGVDLIGLAVMDLVWRHQPDAGMMMILIVPIKKTAAERVCVFDASEAFGKLRLIFQGFEMGFGERVVVGGMRAAVRFGHPKVGQQKGGVFRFHGCTSISVQGELVGWNLMFGDGILEQWTEQGRGFSIGDAPADDAAAEDVEDDVEIEIGPFCWPHQLRYVPAPHLVGAFGE